MELEELRTMLLVHGKGTYIEGLSLQRYLQLSLHKAGDHDVRPDFSGEFGKVEVTEITSLITHASSSPRSRGK